MHCMTDTLPRVVVPYADFLEHRAQRRALAAEVERQTVRRTIDTVAVPVALAAPPANEGAVASPRANEETDRLDHQSSVLNAERIT
jgi:hypothetical protein